MKLIVNKKYYFNFAGSVLNGTFVKEDILTDNSKVYMFVDNKGIIYPIKKDKICGSLKQ